LGVQQGQAAAPDRHRGGVLDGGTRAGQHLPRPALLDPDLGELDAEGDHGVGFLRVAAMLQRLGGKGRCLLQPSGRLGEHGPHEGRHPQVEGLPEALRQAGQQVDLAAGPSQVAEAGKIGGPEVVGGELGHPQRATGRPIAHELGIHDSSLVSRVRQDPIDRGRA
jgi:hypothetical protein